MHVVGVVFESQTLSILPPFGKKIAALDSKKLSSTSLINGIMTFSLLLKLVFSDYLTNDMQ